MPSRAVRLSGASAEPRDACGGEAACRDERDREAADQVRVGAGAAQRRVVDERVPERETEVHGDATERELGVEAVRRPSDEDGHDHARGRPAGDER